MKTYSQFIKEIAEADPNVQALHDYMNTGEYASHFAQIDPETKHKAVQKAIKTAGKSKEPSENMLTLAKLLLHKHTGVPHPNLRG